MDQQALQQRHIKRPSASDRVGLLAAKIPQASRVFARHSIDYCCGGNRSLADACQHAHVDVEKILNEIEAEVARDQSEIPADSLSLDELITQIETVYHAPLREELPRLEEMALKVARVHGERHGEKLVLLAEAIAELKGDIFPHLDKEEQVLFPLIRAGNGAMAQMPISRMQHEHDDHAVILRQIRKLTNDFKVPGDACMTWRALWQSLAALERALHEHIHLENNILFPKALQVD